MKLMLIRHAEPDYAVDSLTEKGRREAELLSRRLARIPDISGIYVSPLGRAQDTAKPSLAACGREAETLEWLREFNVRAYNVVNRRSATVQALAQRDPEDETTVMLCQQVYDLARMAAQPLEAEEITAFLTRSQKLLGMLAK